MSFDAAASFDSITEALVEESDDLVHETPVQNGFTPPSIDKSPILSGVSYTHHSKVPSRLAGANPVECVLGVDEAGRGPVLGISFSTHVGITAV